MSDTLKLILTSIGIGVVILFTIVFLSEFLLGNLVDTDSYKPLLVVIPFMAAIAYYLIKKSK